MSKVEILNRVKDQIQEKGAIMCQYINKDGCMCAVGYVLAECGVNMNMFLHAGLNGEFADMVAENRLVAGTLDQHGFTGEELRRLQEINDNWWVTLEEPERIQAVLKFIDKMIENEEGKNNE